MEITKEMKKVIGRNGFDCAHIEFNREEQKGSISFTGRQRVERNGLTSEIDNRYEIPLTGGDFFGCHSDDETRNWKHARIYVHGTTCALLKTLIKALPEIQFHLYLHNNCNEGPTYDTLYIQAGNNLMDFMERTRKSPMNYGEISVA